MAHNMVRRPDGSYSPLTSDHLKQAAAFPTPSGSLVSSEQILGSVLDNHLQHIGHPIPPGYEPRDPRSYTVENQ